MWNAQKKNEMHTYSCQVRLANEREAPAIAALLRREMPSELRGLTIYDCHGIIEYVRENICVGANGETRYFVAALPRGELAGALEIKHIEAVLFIQYVAVHPDHRRRGVAEQLLANALAAFPHTKSLGLHVIDTNAVALRWYHGIGMRIVGHLDWWTGNLNSQVSRAATLLDESILVRDRWKTFGFSQVVVPTKDGPTKVGILGDSWLRFSDWSIAMRPEVVASVAAEWPGRRALVLSANPPPEALELSFDRVARALVMEGTIAELKVV